MYTTALWNIQSPQMLLSKNDTIHMHDTNVLILDNHGTWSPDVYHGALEHSKSPDAAQ